MIFSLASMTHLGHKESVSLGQPRLGLVFCHDLRSGLSDHLGVKEGLGRRLLKNCIKLKAVAAVRQKALSSHIRFSHVYILIISRWDCCLRGSRSTSLVWGRTVRRPETALLQKHPIYVLQSILIIMVPVRRYVNHLCSG